MNFLSAAHALMIGDYQVLTSESVSIPITLFDDANSLDITVDLSGQTVDYYLEQISSDLILIKIENEIFLNGIVLITIKVDSPNSSASRMFSYDSYAGQNSIDDLVQDEQVYVESPIQQTESKILIPATDIENIDYIPEVKFEDGKLAIDITNTRINVGIAVFELARADNYDVLVLPGDEKIFNSPLVNAVSQWDELFLASNKVVRQVLFDNTRRLVRVVGEDHLYDQDEINKALADVNNTEAQDSPQKPLITIRELVRGFAASHNLELFEMPGDSKFLDLQTPAQNVDNKQTLAIIARSINAKVDVDQNLGIIRVRN